MSRFILLTLCLIALTSFAAAQDSVYSEHVSVEELVSYNKWRFNNGRTYQSEEERLFRQIIFIENKRRVDEHNRSNPTFVQELNQFADNTEEEFKYRVLNSKLSETRPKSKGRRLQSSVQDDSIPENVDWRTTGAVGPIKNQGRCGSCWTFSIQGIIESHHYLKHNEYVNFSEQQLVDCVSTTAGYESDGCNGGWPQEALEYSIEYGVVKSNVYPYVGVQGKCRNIPYDVPRYYPEGWYYHVEQSTEALKRAVSKAPVSVCVDASNWSFYKSGVFNNCGETTYEQLNHAVVAVGYDSEGNWLIRNSWSTKWGESGYMRLAAGNTCGVLIDNLAFDS